LNLLRLFKRYPDERQKQTARLVSKAFGVQPKNIQVYLTALRHKSAAKNIYFGKAESNERLEFLGDAVLDAIVADYLYLHHPEAEEGELTKMKSRIVSRTNLNGMAKAIGLPDLLETDAQAAQSKDSISGNALEAIFGAMYRDKGYPTTSEAVVRVLDKYTDLKSLTNEEADFKSRLYEAAHRQKVQLVFDTHPQSADEGEKRFVSLVFFDKEKVGKGLGTSKKKAEQQAARHALEKLRLK
jgi:ribonuclease-3